MTEGLTAARRVAPADEHPTITTTCPVHVVRSVVHNVRQHVVDRSASRVTRSGPPPHPDGTPSGLTPPALVRAAAARHIVSMPSHTDNHARPDDAPSPAPLLLLTAAQSDDLLSEAAERLQDADHIFAEVMDRGQREDLCALRAEYVAESRFLYAFIADSAIRLVECEIENAADDDGDDSDDA